MYEYRVLDVPRVIDGDTFDFDLDLGFYAILRIRVRLADIDTYEIFGRNAHPLGQPAKQAADEWMAQRLESKTLRVRTMAGNSNVPIGDGSFGRWLGEVYDGQTGELLADSLKEAGFDKVDSVRKTR